MEKEDKVILVTGASSGIGFDTAQTLARQGYCVYAAARRTERMEPLRADGVHILYMDVTDEQSMAEGVATLLEAEGGVDVLINNAGYGFFGAVEAVSMEEARRQLEVNVFGLARLCQLVLPSMRRQHSGRIINLASVAGKAVFYLGAWYNVSKFAVEALSDAMRMELRAFGIDVVLIEPGLIKTDWGLIAARNLKETSVGTAFEHQSTRWSGSMRWVYESGFPSSPKVITRAICRAVESRHPRARYRRGRGACLIVALHALLPTRWWDAFMRRLARFKIA